MKKIILSIFLLTTFIYASAQRVKPLVAGIGIDSILHVKADATKIAMDPVSGHLFYSTVGGDIYEVFITSSGPASDSLRFTLADHGISFLQGLYFRDSVMYICGNIWSAT